MNLSLNPGDLPKQAVNPLAPAQPKNRLADEETFKQYFTALHNAFTTTVGADVENARATRDMDIDVDAMRQAGEIQAGETVVAQRIVDINISRALPELVAYLTQARRLAIFEPVVKTTVDDVNFLESEFRRVMTYENWVYDYTRWGDAMLAHGWGFICAAYNPDMPGAVENQFVSTGDLLFDMRVDCIQKSPLVCRRYHITSISFEEMSETYGFDAATTAELLEKIQDAEQAQNYAVADERNCIYQCFYKFQRQVYVCWYTKDLNKFLKAPELFYNGVDEQVEVLPPFDPLQPNVPVEPQLEWQPAPETDYPFYPALNRVTENERIVETLGRARLDVYTQDAATSLWTAFINGSRRASNVMWSPANPNESAPSAPKQLTMEIRNNAIWSTPMQAFNAPYPSENLPRALDMLRSQNAEDTNQISFAVNNRKDTRKTATEIEAAAAQDSQMSSVPAANWATACGLVFKANWRIIKSQALQGKIKFCSVEVPAEIDPVTGVALTEPTEQNNLQLIDREYKIIPAGTVDYVERIETINSMQTDWPIFATTAAAQAFLEEYIKLKYPLIADNLIEPLRQANANAQQALAAIVPLLQAAVLDEAGNFLPEWKQHEQMLRQLGIVEQPKLKNQDGTTTTGGSNAVPPSAGNTENAGGPSGAGLPQQAGA